MFMNGELKVIYLFMVLFNKSVNSSDYITSIKGNIMLN
jgi:hypothetical protein